MTDETFVNQNDVEGTANGVWSRMLAGNRRFTEGKLEHPNRSVEAREAVIDTHEPDAAVLSCSFWWCSAIRIAARSSRLSRNTTPCCTI